MWGCGVSDLTRITFNASPRAYAALTRLEQASGENRTQVINSSLRLVGQLSQHAVDGAITLVVLDGTRVEVLLP
jgi:hypothetical protein